MPIQTSCFEKSKFQSTQATNFGLLLGVKAQQNRTEQNRQKLKNRKNIQEQTKPYLQNRQLISACGSRAGQRMQEEGKYML